MNLSIDIRLDLSPAFATALQELARALGGRGLPPLRPYEKPDWLSHLDRELAAGKTVPVSAEPFVRVDTVADIEVRTAPTKPPPSVQGEKLTRWTDERKALIRDEYTASTDLPDLHRRLNKLPGAHIPYDIMRWWANRQGLASPARRKVAKPAEPEVLRAPAEDKPPPSPPAWAAAAKPTQTADDATIRNWAAMRGLCNGGERLDLERVNRKRADLGLPAFVRQNGLSHSSATLRGPATGGVR